VVVVWFPRLGLAGPSSVTSIRAVLPVTDTDSRAVVRVDHGVGDQLADQQLG
jgi:hypothetical protein